MWTSFFANSGITVGFNRQRSTYSSVLMSPGMETPNFSLPSFKTYAEGEAIQAVEPEQIKRMWEFERTHSRAGTDGWKWLQDLHAAMGPGAEFSDVSSRHRMVDTLTQYDRGQLLAPWHHGDELDDAVFRIAATFPLREHKPMGYMIAGDERFGFDPNAFVQKLTEETGIVHVWKPVVTKIPEGGWKCCYFTTPSQDPERQAKRRTRQLTWSIWKRFSPSLKIVSHIEKEQATEIVATFFANFLLDNIDLVRQLEDAFRDMQHVPLDPILSELERKAQHWGV
jgi:hypothetical protein